MRGMGAVLAVLPFLTACGLLQPTPDAGLPVAELDTEPVADEIDHPGDPATGPVVQVAAGEVEGQRFRYSVHRSVEGVCASFEWEDNSATGCGALPGDMASDVFGMMMFGDDGFTQDMTGIVSAAVDAVWIELDSGARARAILLDLDAADIEANAFIAFVPVGVAPVAVLAVDGAGDPIERFEVGRVPPGNGAVPTPAVETTPGG